MRGGGDEWLWFRGRPRLCRLMSCCLPTSESTSPINAKLMGIRLAAAAPTLLPIKVLKFVYIQHRRTYSDKLAVYTCKLHEGNTCPLQPSVVICILLQLMVRRCQNKSFRLSTIGLGYQKE
jgi:hypothetical protein